MEGLEVFFRYIYSKALLLILVLVYDLRKVIRMDFLFIERGFGG